MRLDYGMEAALIPSLTLVCVCFVELLLFANVIQARPESLQPQPHGSPSITLSSFPHDASALQLALQQLQQHHAGQYRPAKLPDALKTDVEYFDRINVDAQLHNRRFVELQIKCLIYSGPCDIFGRKAKALLPSVILDNCRWCSQSQKTKLSRVVVHIQQNYPGAWRDALVKYGSSPKGFITAGQAAPSSALFGKPVHEGHEQYGQNGHYPQIIYIQVPQTTQTSQVLSEPQDEVVSPLANLTFDSSPAPELVRAVESPTPPMDPTPSPRGYEITSSVEPPSTSAMESTIEVKPTTAEP